MLVKDWMSKDVTSLNITDTLQHAINLSSEKNISIMPVLESGKLVGIVTDRDLKRVSPSDATRLNVEEIKYRLSRVEVGTIMTPHPIIVPPDYTIEETAEILLTNKISGVPVVDDKGTILGVITKNDLFKAMMSLTGLLKRGLQFGFLLEDRPGSIKEVTDIIRHYDGRLASILSSYERAPQGYRHVYIRAFNIDRSTMTQLLEELKANANVLYMVDHRENKREIYADSLQDLALKTLEVTSGSIS
ncbi:CBS and ACT domain-containing protein [Desulfomonile tiedjei]|uniref:CBS domain-containing protein n=1 Tax=Desulfomonile tiedjei (strain ATCC 49306 / DSM 6799 / DCB-1) TaxID=706587 RepID=I4C516_DESTA|nr:CBS and ACT domain-containing protein [Desulfomonile tiedjei]AFM24657.1 CBS domain-containing protein [Desulfomonile tiedjei DSM 6799]